MNIKHPNQRLSREQMDMYQSLLTHQGEEVAANYLRYLNGEIRSVTRGRIKSANTQ